MQSFPKTLVTIAAFVFVLNLFVGCEDKNVLRLMEARSKSLKSFQADIKLDNFNAQLGEHDFSNGRLIYAPQGKTDARVRLDFNKPAQESLTVFDKQFVLYRASLNQAIIGRIDARKSFAPIEDAIAFMNVNKERLKSDYNVKYVGEEKTSEANSSYHLEFTPKESKDYKTVEFWIDKSGMPLKVKVILNNNDSMTVSFTNVKKNIAINPNIFKINFPKNAKIIKT